MYRWQKTRVRLPPNYRLRLVVSQSARDLHALGVGHRACNRPALSIGGHAENDASDRAELVEIVRWNPGYHRGRFMAAKEYACRRSRDRVRKSKPSRVVYRR
jgi:hypothetical protein